MSNHFYLKFRQNWKLITIFMVLGFIILTLWLLARRSLPRTEGVLKLQELQSEVTVLRDGFGIPHIKANNEKDLFFSLGYTLASDRLFQMDIMRRIATGRLSEIFGKRTLKLDTLLRNLRIKKSMDEYWEIHQKDVDPAMLELSQAFLAGITKYIETAPLPPEFLILGYKPEPFTITESMAVSGYMALSFAEGLVGDILFHELKDKLPKERLAELRIGTKADASPLEKNNQALPVPQPTPLATPKPFKPIMAAPIVTPGPETTPESEPEPTPLESAEPEVEVPPQTSNENEKYDWTVAALEQLEKEFGLFQGSNSWVLGPKKSMSGQSILANDPHITFMNPSVFYEASLHSPTLEIYGHFMPLVPFPILGHDKNKGWAITMSESDDMDIYKEKYNPLDENSIFHDQKWIGLDLHEEVIKVKGERDVHVTIKVSPHGPMLLAEDPNQKGDALSSKTSGTDKNYYSIKWTYYHPENHVSWAFYKLMRATNLSQFKDAISYAAAPGLNISWADKDGHIAWWVMGKIPKLPPGVDSDTVLEGDTGRHEYLGYLGIDENPHEVDPASGMIVSANYRPQFQSFKNIDGYWQPSERYERITELLSAKEKWNLEDLKKVQNDSLQTRVPEFLNIMVSGLKTSTLIPPLKFKNNFEKISAGIKAHPRSDVHKKLELELLPHLEKWDGQSTLDSVGASIFHVWTKYIGQEVLIDELGERDFLRFTRLADYRHFYKWILNNPSSPWWDDIRTTDFKETRDDILKRTYKMAIIHLDDFFKSSITQWWWGRLHAVEFQHFLGKAKPLNYLFNIGPFMAPGGAHEINNIDYPRYENTFHPNKGPSTRRLIDFADPGESWGILPTGQSGHFLSTHFQDQTLLYLKGQYRKQLLDWDKIQSFSSQKLLLTP